MNPFQTLGNPMDVDQPKGDTEIFPEGQNGKLYDLKCNNEDADLLSSDNESTIWEAPGQDSCVDVRETEIAIDLRDPVSPAQSPDIEGEASYNKLQSCSDRSGMEHEIPVLQASYTETDDTAVKDICVDEGLPLNNKPLSENISDESFQQSPITYPTKGEECCTNNGKVDVEWPVPEGLKSLTNDTFERDFNDLKVIHQNESMSVADLVLNDASKQNGADMIMYEDTHTEDTLVKPSTEIGCRDEVGNVDMVRANKVAEDNLITSTSALESSGIETDDDSHEETSDLTLPPPEADTFTYPAANNIHKEDLHITARPPPVLQTVLTSDPQKLAADQLSASARFKQDHLESSFASVGPYSGSVTYSGPIAYSGSISHRSDASSVSTRSFAFPVLQNEWNFSPVRMQKADRRYLRRHRGWMHGLFCCKF